MNHCNSLHEPSLIDVQVAFEHWRLDRRKRQPTTKHLRSLAVALLGKHLPFTICKALGVNGTALKQWANEEPVVSQTPFVVLPEAPPAEVPDATVGEPALLIKLPNGVQVSLMPGFSLRGALAAASAVRVSHDSAHSRVKDSARYPVYRFSKGRGRLRVPVQEPAAVGATRRIDFRVHQSGEDDDTGIEL